VKYWNTGRAEKAASPRIAFDDPPGTPQNVVQKSLKQAATADLHRELS
jgi:hypothetical protein